MTALGIKWTTGELNILKASYSTASWEELSQLLPGRSYKSIGLKAYKLEIGLNRPRYHTPIKISQGPMEYLAGFFDGEGSVQIAKRIKVKRKTPNYCLSISCANAHQGIINLYKATFGGSIEVTQQKKSNHASYRWRADGGLACAVLERLLPFFVVKKQRAELAISFQRNLIDGKRTMRGKSFDADLLKRRDEAWALMRKLNQEYNYRGHIKYQEEGRN